MAAMSSRAKKRGSKKGAAPKHRPQIWPYYAERSGTIMSRVMSMVRLSHSVSNEVLSRRRYKDKIESHLTGSFFNLLYSKLAMLHGQKQEAARYRQQVEEDIEWELPGWILHPVKGFDDRQKAALEALNNLRAEEEYDRKMASRLLKKQSGLRRMKRLPKNAAEEFFSWANYVIDEIFFLEELQLERESRKNKARSVAARKK
jgi:hypothetical protein